MSATLEQPTQATNRAAVYLRQSSDPSGQQIGVDRQRDEILRYIQARGWTPVAEFMDNDMMNQAALRGGIAGPINY